MVSTGLIMFTSVGVAMWFDTPSSFTEAMIEGNMLQLQL